MEKDILKIETEIFNVLKTIFDPEIPVNIYDLGLIYDVEVDEYDNVDVTMTLTAPNCPVADNILRDVRDNVGDIEGVNKVNVELTFEPPWDKSMMSEQAKLELGFL